MVLLSLSDDAAVAEIVGQLGRGDLAGKLIVDTSTVSPDTLRRLAGAIGEAGGAALDAPVSGGPDLVLAGKAGFYIGGAQADFERFRPVAEAMSNRIHHVGALGEGAAAKPGCGVRRRRFCGDDPGGVSRRLTLDWQALNTDFSSRRGRVRSR